MSRLTEITLSGTPRQRGRAYGEGLRRLIRERDAAWRHDIATVCKVPSERLLAELLAQTDFLPAIRTHTPDLLEEVEGIAEGSGLAFSDVLAAQLMDEQWWFVTAFKRRHHCSSLGAVAADGRSGFLAQNMDLPGWMDGFQTALVILGPDGRRSTVLTVAGMIGLCGMTELPDGGALGLCVNTLAQLNPNPKGLPVAFVSRGVLACRGFAAGRRFLETVPHASGQNYILCDGRALVDLECSAAGTVAVRNAGGSDQLVWHTNHPLASGDHRRTASGRKVTARGVSSVARLTVLDRVLARRRSSLDAADAKALLADRSNARHPVSRPLKGAGAGYTFASVVWHLGRAPRAEIAAGPPSAMPFATIRPAAPTRPAPMPAK